MNSHPIHYNLLLYSVPGSCLPPQWGRLNMGYAEQLIMLLPRIHTQTTVQNSWENNAVRVFRHSVSFRPSVHSNANKSVFYQMANTHFFLQPTSLKDIKIVHHRLCITVPGTFNFSHQKYNTNCFPDQMLKAKAANCFKSQFEKLSSSDSSLITAPQFRWTVEARPREPPRDVNKCVLCFKLDTLWSAVVAAHRL